MVCLLMEWGGGGTTNGAIGHGCSGDNGGGWDAQQSSK